MKKWKDTRTSLVYAFVFAVRIRCLLLAFVYLFVRSILLESTILITLYFGLILVAVKIIPRLLDRGVQSRT